MWKSTVERGRSQITIWDTSTVCRVTKDTHTLSQHATLTDFPLQQWC